MTAKLYLTKLDPLQLVSCKIINYPYDPHLSKLGSELKEFLLGKENLETLHLTCTGYDDAIPNNGTQSHERMPAVKEMVSCRKGSASNPHSHFRCHNGCFYICGTTRASIWTSNRALIKTSRTSAPFLQPSFQLCWLILECIVCQSIHARRERSKQRTAEEPD